MKYQKILNTFFALIAFLILGWAAFMQPKGILNLGILTGFLSYSLLFISFTPMGKLTLGDRTAALPLTTWLWKLLQGQLVLLIFSLGVLLAFLSIGPQFAYETMTVGLIKETLSAYFSWQWGLFPWGIYGICALVLAYIVYIKRGVPFIYQITRENCPKRYEPMIKTYTDGAINNATITAYSLVIASIILLFSYSLEGIIGSHHFYVPFVTISLLSLFMPWYILRKGRRMLNRLMRRKASINQVYFLFIPPLVALLVISALGNKWFVQHYAQYFEHFQCRQCSMMFSQSALIERFSSLYWGWWLLWTPLASSYIASITQGRTIRELAFGVLCVPLMIYIFLGVGGAHLIALLLLKMRQIPLSITLFLLAALLWYLFYKCNQGQTSSSIFYSGFMPDNSPRRSRLWLRDGSKIMAISKLTPKLAMNVTVILFLHAMMGWYGIQLQVAVMAAILLGVIYGEIDFLIYRFFKDRIWQKNRTIPPFS